MLIMFQKV